MTSNHVQTLLQDDCIRLRTTDMMQNVCSNTRCQVKKYPAIYHLTLESYSLSDISGKMKDTFIEIKENFIQMEETVFLNKYHY